MKYMVNSQALEKAMYRQGLSIWKAAMASGISTASITNYLREDMVLQRMTAKKLRDTFGEQVVYEVEDES